MRVWQFACLVVALWTAGAAAAATPTETYRIPGLLSAAEIHVDEWGVPHIYAGSQYDAFFVQGFNAARDRLWQIDLWRRRGLGELSAVLGPDYVAQDRAARLFLYRGDMYREWLAYGSDAKRIAEAFTAGINAYVDLTAAHPEWLPPEFGVLGYRPARWSASDVVRIRGNGLWRNLTNEVERAKILCRFPASIDSLHKRLEPNWNVTVPTGLDPCEIPKNVLDVYLLAKAPVTFSHPSRALAEATNDEHRTGIGSNNWVVAPSRTASGRPILANDPHRGHAVPSLRYAAHLVAPGLDVIGAGEPALPGISIGHNERIAFGLTIFPIDQEDLYVYDTRPDAPQEYRYGDRWEPMTTLNESIEVRDAPAQSVELRFTRHGPVIFEDREHHRAYAARVAWLEPGMAPYFGSVEYMRAQNWDQFVAALNRWGAPSENQVYADVDGNIGYKPAGLFPRRTNWDGLLPVPGDGRYEWDGFFDMDALPQEFNPARGFVATANAMNLPEDYPINARRIGFEWSAPWRARRITEVLEAQPHHTFADSLALQRDYTSTLALELVRRIPTTDNDEAAKMLREWNGVLSPDSAAAALYVVWYNKRLNPALAAWAAPADAVPLIQPIDSLAALDLIDSDRPATTPLIENSLRAAWADTRALLGPDPAAWRWGTLHKTAFRHPLGDRLPQGAMNAYSRGGDGTTPNNTSFDGADYSVTSGASWRMVLDVGNWDAAQMTNAPGQSGDPRSPFYSNLLEGWSNDRSFPLLYSRTAVDGHVVKIIRLLPP
ncbi:MAG TPA: penicillin acylase family protein [Pseudomonadales bacterium]|nr:penicillin acylase family protein [Pseudomonadales bacterium]